MAIVGLPAQQYRAHIPSQQDAFCVIEVSDSTLERDRGEKLETYARNKIAEYWVLNVTANELEVCREPDGSRYLSRRILKARPGGESAGISRCCARVVALANRLIAHVRDEEPLVPTCFGEVASHLGRTQDLASLQALIAIPYVTFNGQLPTFNGRLSS